MDGISTFGPSRSGPGASSGFGGSSRVDIAPFGELVTATLDPSPPELGGQVCYGAEAGDFYCPRIQETRR